ncbi:MAG: phage baseplate assembly protein V [Pseudomonadota bacterium]|nr:phage baseplate assembly protein V [Pseudomonadota bacterium]
MDTPAAENHRRIEHALRVGTVMAVDHGRAVCRVRTGEITTDWIPWFVPRAGDTIEWSAPSVGEQLMLLSTSGDTTGAVALRGIYSNTYPAPANAESKHVHRYKDGAWFEYDDEAHSLVATLPDGGTATLTALGGTTINGDVQINGMVRVSETVIAEVDVIAAGISLVNHVHRDVVSGPADTGKPK